MPDSARARRSGIQSASTPNDDQAEIIQFLSRPASYCGDIESVETITTHASIVFLAGDRAVKLKRAVKYTYLDYSTTELRHRACEAELALNRRTAPALYLSATPICRTPDGKLSFNGRGEPVDWVIVMRRFPQDALFSRLAERGALTTRLAFDLADRVAAFHEVAEVQPGQGGAQGIAAVIQINDENLRRSPPLGIGAVDIDRLRDGSRAALAKHAALLDRRRETGRVRRCHGDLHLGNICLIDGQPTLFDCIEFSDLISCIDVLYDLAFLLMDLRYRGLVRECGLIFNRYLDLARDDDGVAAMPLFMSLRAAVRAHVTAAAAAGPEAADLRERKLAEASSYFDLAVDLLAPRAPQLLAVGGLSGTGKSSVAAALAGELGIGAGARVLRSDVVRKQLFGSLPEERLPAEAYSMTVNERVYATLERRAAALLAAGHTVVIDAVCARPEERTALADLARRTRAGFAGVWLQAPTPTLLARLAQRGKDASDATTEILQRQLTYDLGVIDWARIDAGEPRDAVIEAAREAFGVPASRDR
jgi:aminoglycoside phosphotransferase family enzyme/predicted kinase